MDWHIDAFEQFDVSLSNVQKQQFEQYEHELIDWNTNRFNLTAITEPEQIHIRHFYDSLSILRDFSLDAGDKLIDIGSGAGFPGLPIAIARPDLKITVMDATGKRVRFLQHIIDTLALSNANAIQMRAEDAGRDRNHRAQYDIVTARAVARLPILLEYMIPLAKVEAFCVAMKGSSVYDEVDDSAKALRTLNAKVIDITEVHIPVIDHIHYLAIIEKVKHTPKAYPRNAGTPSREPIQ